MYKIGADQASLCRREIGVDRKGFFHFGGARLERPEQVAVPSLKILKHFAQLTMRCCVIESKDTGDDMVRPYLVGGVEISRFSCRLKWAHNHPRRIGAQIESLTI